MIDPEYRVYKKKLQTVNDILDLHNIRTHMFCPEQFEF